MSANVKKIVLLVVLVSAAIGAFVWNMGPSAEQKAQIERVEQQRANRDKPKALAPAKTTSQPRAEAELASQFDVADVDIEALLQDIQDVEFEYNIERLSRDPMSPLIGLQASTESTATGVGQAGADERLLHMARLKAVTGIVWDDTDPFAVIDNEVVTEGYGYPDGIVLDEIHPDHVVFRINDARVEVELKEQ